mmetsp:Transcript_22366/g.26394  ORF Transcript_22366/g.26394 Transcript_22366/m.26394 type:complete len:535 (+) Transcript_22366:62-1666(+)
MASLPIDRLEHLYFGSKAVFLTEVAGEVETFPPKHGWANSPVPNSVEWELALKETLALTEPLTHLGSDYSNIVQPCIVAVPCVRNKEPPQQKSKTEEDEHSIPYSSNPLLKIPESQSTDLTLVGVASGVRSAIVKLGGKWTRLKGCGNHDQGFPVQSVGVLACGAPALSVRGSCFDTTVDREACMTSHIASLLDVHGVPVGNRSIAAFHYDTPSRVASSSEDWPQWPHPLVTRHCGVFETLGDRRAGDHLLGGLEILLNQLLPMDVEQLALLAQDVNEGRGLPRTTDLFSTDMLAYAGEPPPQPTKCLHIETLKDSAPSLEMEKVPSEYAEVWKAEVTSLMGFLDQRDSSDQTTPGTSIVMALAWRIGWECGRVQRILTAGEVSWGTYPDSMGTHCNAHANNMVVLDFEASQKHGCFLAPVDFDMCFSRSGYLPDVARNYQGFDADWVDLVRLETEGFYATLAGSDFVSTGVGNVSDSTDPRRIALRDTVCSGFRTALENDSDEHALATLSPKAHRACTALVRMALIATHEVET